MNKNIKEGNILFKAGTRHYKILNIEPMKYPGRRIQYSTIRYKRIRVQMQGGIYLLNIDSHKSLTEKNKRIQK